MNNDRIENYAPKYIELFNAVLEDKGVVVAESNAVAKYLMIVKTAFIEPGYNVGVSRKNAYINLEVCFTENGNQTMFWQNLQLLNFPEVWHMVVI